MTAIVGMALGHRPIPNQPPAAAHTANFLLNASGSPSVSSFPTVRGDVGVRSLMKTGAPVQIGWKYISATCIHRKL